MGIELLGSCFIQMACESLTNPNIGGQNPFILINVLLLAQRNRKPAICGSFCKRMDFHIHVTSGSMEAGPHVAVCALGLSL